MLSEDDLINDFINCKFRENCHIVKHNGEEMKTLILLIGGVPLLLEVGHHHADLDFV